MFVNLQRMLLVLLAWSAAALAGSSLLAEPIPVRYTEGRVHGFLVVRDQDDHIIGSGELCQSAKGSRVTTSLTLHLKDGSVYEETTTFTQQRVFRLVKNHVVEKGPSFKRPMDMSLDAVSGAVKVSYTDDHGEAKVIEDRLKLPPDVANGMVTMLLPDIDPKAPETTLSLVAATPKPRLVKLKITPGGDDPFSLAGVPRKAMRYIIKIEIGGVAGVVAPLVGKEPRDILVWIIREPVPGFLRSEGSFSEGGPVWRIELASPVWPKTSP
jgi:hypothetical protein